MNSNELAKIIKTYEDIKFNLIRFYYNKNNKKILTSYELRLIRDEITIKSKDNKTYIFKGTNKPVIDIKINLDNIIEYNNDFIAFFLENSRLIYLFEKEKIEKNNDYNKLLMELNI